MSDIDRDDPGAVASKLDPEDVELRAKPRPVTRINRKVLFGGTGMIVLMLTGAVMVALDPPSWRSAEEAKELYNVSRKPKPDVLAQLPESYADVVPKLGPPNPGDLGKAVVNTERDLGLSPYRPDPESDRARAERIRLARLAQQARESRLFFALNARRTDVDTRTRRETNNGARPQSPLSDLTAFTSALNANTADNATNGTAGRSDRSDQNEKLAFLHAKTDESIYNKRVLQTPTSPYQLQAGTAIAASLITGLNSDLPGFVIALTTEHLYDSVSGEHLLIPQGSRLIGKYDSAISSGQKRALVVWQRIILPDGSSVVIDNLPATDAAGYVGLEDEVDFHTWQLIKGIALATVFGVGTQLSLGNNENDIAQAVRESVQDNTNEADQKLIERRLDQKPTLTVQPGWPLRVIVHKDIILKPYLERARVGR